MLPRLLFAILLLFSAASTGSSSSPLRGMVCWKRINRTVTYMQPVRFTELVRTRKCRFVIFCKTVYRTRESYRLERRTRTMHQMMGECCEGFHERNRRCIPDELPTTTRMQQRTSEDTNRVNVGIQPNAQNFSNTTEPILFGKNQELHITDSNQTTVIIAFIGCSLSVVILIIIIVIYKRRKKAGKYMSEIPYSPDVMPLPSKSKKDCSASQDGLNSRNFPTTDENFYMSMDNGCQLQVPSVKMMLATRGSRYRFSGLEDDPHRHTDSLYMSPDPATYNNENNKSTNSLSRKCLNKPKHGKNVTDIYINDHDINMAEKIPEDDEENIYSEIKAKNFKQNGLAGDENGYSFIKMYCMKGPETEGEHCEAETSLYSSLNENNSNDVSNAEDKDIKYEMDSKPTNACKKTKDTFDRAKIRTSSGRQNDNTDEKEDRDDACDSGIYTSIPLDSDKDDEIYTEPTYDMPKIKMAPAVEETKIQTGSDYYENCRENSDESNYDIPRSQMKDEDAIYTDITSTSTNSPVISRVS